MFAFDAGLALTVFIATDIDDLLLLAAFFANARFSARAIVGGQFAGIAVLVCVSAAAALLALAIPRGWVALLGLVPLGMGLVGLWRLRGTDNDDDDEESMASIAAEHRVESRLHSQWLAVAAVTIANGGDNLGAYIPLFARSPELIAVYAIVFGVMTALWCALAYWLTRHPLARSVVSRYADRLLPVVLVAFGLVVLADTRLLLQ